MIKQVTVTNLIMPPLGDPILTRCSRLYMTLHDYFWFVLRSAARVLSSWQSRRCGIGDRAWDHQLWASAIWALPMASYGILWHPMALLLPMAFLWPCFLPCHFWFCHVFCRRLRLRKSNFSSGPGSLKYSRGTSGTHFFTCVRRSGVRHKLYYL